MSADWGIFERDEPYQVHIVPIEDSQEHELRGGSSTRIQPSAVYSSRIRRASYRRWRDVTMTHNGTRTRLTKGTVKNLDVEVLEQAYAKTQIFLRCAREGLIKPSPIDRAKSQRHRIILRNELLRRKFSKENVDTEPEIPEGLRKELEARCETGKP